MLDQFKHIISRPFQDKQYAIVGIQLGDTPVYNVLILDKKGDELSKTDSFSTDDFDVVTKKVKTSIPVLLHFSGKGVINKKVGVNGDYLKEVFFNGVADDFYIYQLYQEQHNFISIVRKESVEHCFSLLATHKFLVVDYSVGPFVGMAFQELLNESLFFSGDYEFAFEESYLSHFNKHEYINKEYALGSELISNVQVPLFSTAINYLYPSDAIGYTSDFLEKNKQENVFKKIFEISAVAIGIFFLSTLLISYLLLNHYNNRHVNYESQLYNLNDTYKQIKKIEEEKDNKTKILSESGMLNQNFISFYMYRITNSIPKDIGLETLQVNPLKKKIKNFEKIMFETNSIVVLGNSESSMSVNSWVKVLKKEDWISKIEILDFSKNRSKKSEFTLKIMIK